MLILLLQRRELLSTDACHAWVNIAATATAATAIHATADRRPLARKKPISNVPSSVDGLGCSSGLGVVEFGPSLEDGDVVPMGVVVEPGLSPGLSLDDGDGVPLGVVVEPGLSPEDGDVVPSVVVSLYVKLLHRHSYPEPWLLLPEHVVSLLPVFEKYQAPAELFASRQRKQPVMFPLEMPAYVSLL